MAEEKGSSLVHLLVIVLGLTAFGFAIAAERRRTTATLQIDASSNKTYCVYNSDVASGYGVGAVLFALSSQSLIMGITKCMCFGRPLAPGSNRAWTIIYFLSSWITFIVSEACLISGARTNGYHTRYRDIIHADGFSCEALRKGIFIAGAVFVMATTILNVYYYAYFSRATARKVTIPSIGMAGKA